MISGIYQIKNKLNGKLYIGSAENISRRWKEHIQRLIRNQHENKYLQNAYNKNNSVFEYSILLYCDRKDLLFFEQRFLDIYWDNKTNCYNMCLTAGSQLGFKHSVETKNKLRQPKSEETKKKMSQSKQGKSLSNKTKEKISHSILLNPPNAIKEEKRRAVVLNWNILNITKTQLADIFNIERHTVARILKQAKSFN